MNKKKLTVYKSNQIIEAGFKLTLNEQRVILACISQVNSTEKLLETDTFELSAKSFSLLFSVSEERSYHALVDVTETLFNRYVVVENPVKHPKLRRLKVRWISSIGYMPNEGKISLCFAQNMLPYLSELKGQFTRYELQNIGNMTCIYSIRLYELLMQWRTTGKREVEIEWLKQQFQIEKEYPRMYDFKKYVIEPAIKGINQHSDYSVSWTQRKTGRRVSHLTFTFDKQHSKHSKQKNNPTTEQCFFGVPKSKIERLAKTGESWEQAAIRIKAKNL